MTTIPVYLGWLILAGFILMSAMAYLASYEGNRHATRWHRKWMKTRKLELDEGWKQLQAERNVLYEDVTAREVKLHDERRELGRKAHDLATQTHVVLQQANRPNHVPEMQEPSEPDRAYGNGETFTLEGPPVIFDHKRWGPGFTVDEEAASAKGWRRGEHEWVKDQQ